jgi:hypothetical protein
MFPNNIKTTSFYPSKKVNHSNFQNLSLNNTSYNFQNIINNGNDYVIIDSVELALITLNLTYKQFKIMNYDDLDNYTKTIAGNHSFDNKKFYLAFNILANELYNLQQKQIIKQEVSKEQTHIKTNPFTNFNQNVIVVEPDEFKLNLCSLSNTKQMNKNIMQNQPITQVHNQTQEQSKFTIQQKKNLDLSTYSGNPFGITKITNNNYGNSIKPIHRSNDKTSVVSFNDKSYTDFNTNKTQFNNNSNNIVKQSSFIQNPNIFANGGKRRSSNLDVSSSVI